MAGGHAGVDPVREPVVALRARLDDGRGMDARPGPEGVAPDHRVPVGDRHFQVAETFPT